ncbi:MAG: copper amine oxidase N-terminal domain-containing protein, partial [Clostridiales bacterium]|nr:copper amine oxidase N-terminal domain-containing protein [Clostridiales bacterium]
EIIKLSLPYGYHFTDNLSTLKVGLESGLAWGDGSTGYGIQNSSNSTGKNYYPVFAEGYEYNDKLSGSLSSNDSYDELWIFLGAITPSTQLRGSVYIEGLQIWADDDAAVPAAGKEIEIKMHVDGEHNITEQDVLVAKRVDWLLGLKTLTTVPTLVSGRYIGPSWDGTDADDNTHKTARVQLYESAANSWWGSRTTVLALPATDNNTVKGAKFRRVEVHDRDHISTSQDIKDTRFVSALYSSSSNTQKTTTNVPTDEGVYLNDGEKHGAITVNDNKITISNISLNGKDKAWINFDLWVSVEYGFGKQSGDLKLSIDPSSTSITGAAAAELPSVVIAHIVDPITVSANVSDVKIGYQYQTTSDIQIKENGAGYLLKNKTVKVSITDLISSDLFFTNDTKIQVTAGDLKINNIYATGQGGFTSQSRSWLEATSGTGTLSFDIERASTTASTVTISNVAVKLDRTVPVTNKNSYQAVVWGTAVAENYGLIDDSGRTWKADFNTVGEFLPYINVISSADDASSILTQEVRVTIGESFYVVNGKTYSMDAVAYISTASNSTMVPLRFVANAFGLRDDQILWDDSTKTATILAPNRTLQFTLNKSTMLVNGTAVTMVSPDGKAVVAEIKTINGLGRMYLPFRALGNAFGIPVDWEADTNTAIYNKGANANGTSSVTNVTPVAS